MDKCSLLARVSFLRAPAIFALHCDMCIYVSGFVFHSLVGENVAEGKVDIQKFVINKVGFPLS